MKALEMDNEEPITRESVLKLMEKKDKIESELRELKEILDGNNIGMTEPLVDREGYPRGDIDVYQVRQARHKIICLQNDHKSVMKEIENGLHYLHSQINNSLGNSTNSNDTNSPEQDSRAFAEIRSVHFDSPAYRAGLQAGDLVLSFGSVNFDNFKSMQDIASVVQHSVGRSIKVIIKRGNQRKTLQLIPKEWSGSGLLGCVIVLIDNVER
ncbi:UNVERIFIED_CONTAM: hypothetical protein PYX00_007693 [Menopon gallinae]|uniref:26S proteasome non-ATPase regulatory subunit 9 n=1 Tax=Menopon gallinae TaxID=328185 RepID=A0AAW2HLA5_9NEOP